MKKKVALYTVGCRLNQSETAVLTDRLMERGYQKVECGEPIDLLVLNTCTVTENAEADCRRVIRRTLRHSPNAFVAVTGCYAQTGMKTLQNVPGVDLVLGNQYKMTLPDYLEDVPHLAKHSAAQVRHSGTMDREDFVQEGVGTYATTRANLKIQDGCNFMCSFCLIPFARGRERSRRIDDAVREAERLVERGHRELVLTGVNVGRFKHGPVGLLELIQRLEAVPGLARIRISSIEPTTIPDALLDYMSTSDKLCRFLHVPLQSGHDDVLAAMNRRYTVSDYTSWVERAVQTVPDVCVGTDVLVGFPGETDRQFSATRQVIEDLPVAYAHVFRYSSRPGTPAARAGNPVPRSVISTRSRLLSRLSRTKRMQFSQRFLDQERDVLFEAVGKNGLWTGVTDNFLRVGVPHSSSLTNQIRKVRLTGVMEHVVLGKLVDETRQRSKNVPILVMRSSEQEQAGSTACP